MPFKLIAPLCGLFLFFNVVTSAQESYPEYNAKFFDAFPSYEDILRYASKVRPTLLSAPEHQFNFEKTADGWHLREYEDLSEDSSSKMLTLWLFESGYKDSDALDKPDPAGLDRFLERKLTSFSSDYYDLCPVYGYKGYQEDLILLLRDEKDLSAGCMDCYARALFDKSTNLIHPYQLTGGGGYLKYDSTFILADLSEDMLFRYMELADNSLEAFRKLSQNYPDYSTIVGNIRQKYFNSIMAVYYNLRFTGRPDLAAKYLPEGLYDPAMIEFSRNILKSCPDNAILFTWGDSDTYPLVYLQEKLGFRKDVTIVNNNLINLGKYIHYLKNLLDDKRNISTTLTSEEYRLDRHNVLRVDPGTDNPPTSFREYLQELNAESQKFEVLNDGQRWTIMPLKNVRIPIGENPNVQPSAITVRFNRSFLLKADLFTLDLLATNAGKRPVCFTLGFRGSKNLGLDKFRKFDGFVMTLTADRSQIKINPDALGRLLLKEYSFPKISKKKAAQSEYRFFSGNGLYLFYLLLNAYLEEERYDDFFMAYDALTLQLPHEIFPYERYHLVFSQLLLDAGDKTKARIHLDALAAELDQKFDIYASMGSSELIKNRKAIARNLKTMKDLLRFTSDFFDPSIFEALEIRLRPVLLEWENK